MKLSIYIIILHTRPMQICTITSNDIRKYFYFIFLSLQWETGGGKKRYRPKGCNYREPCVGLLCIRGPSWV